MEVVVINVKMLMAGAEARRSEKQCKNVLLLKKIKQVVFDYILLVYFMMLSSSCRGYYMQTK